MTTLPQHEEEKKKENPVKKFFKAVFVHNFWGKLSAVIVSVVLWILAVQLLGRARRVGGREPEHVAAYFARVLFGRR